MAAQLKTTTTTTPSVIPDSQPVSSQLDDEIATIRAQTTALTHQRSLLRATLLSSKLTQSLLAHTLSPSPNTALPTTNASPPPTTTTTTALHHATHQAKHNTLNLHRLCAGATMFRVRDPDPHAVDGGRIYGVRIEVFCDGKFLTPYYLLLHRPYRDSAALRVHRHTLPPCVPLPALVATFLPLSIPVPGEDANANAAPVKGAAKTVQRQDLPRLVRELRRELVGWHLRRAWVGRLRGVLGVGVGASEREERVVAGMEMGRRRGGRGIKEVEAVDAEGMDVRIEWEDGRVGRVRVDKGGRVERAVVLGEKGRERDVERRLCGGDGRMEGLAGRLLEISAVA